MGRIKKKTHEEWLERNKRREEGLRGRDKARIKEYKERKQYFERFGINSDLRNSSSKSKKQNKYVNNLKPKNISQAELKRRREERLDKEETVNAVITEKVNWILLPAGTDWVTFEKHFNEKVKNSGRKLDPNQVEVARERLKRIYELKPIKTYNGIETYSDYFAYLFNGTDKVLLESVIYGNAAYVVSSNWRELSRLTKTELKEMYKPIDEAKDFRHIGDWFSKLKNYLQIGFE